MSDLPARFSDLSGQSRQVTKAVRAQEHTELAIFEHNLAARYQTECDRIDSQAIADVTKTALEEEMNILDWGLDQAAGSQSKAQLVADKVAMLSKIDSARIARRFGG